MREIKLTKGCIAIIDKDDYDSVSIYKWYVTGVEGAYYASRAYRKDGISKQQKMHRFLLGVTDPSVFVDHIDGDGLNNRRANLRICTNRQNAMNKKADKGGYSKYKGVTYYKRNKKWGANISCGNRRNFLGLFDTQQEAAKAYDEAAKTMFGEFAKLNNINN